LTSLGVMQWEGKDDHSYCDIRYYCDKETSKFEKVWDA